MLKVWSRWDSRRKEGLGEGFSFDVKGERWDLTTGGESKFDDGRGKLVTFSYLW